jgi:tetratricopeptide (TPR) repeat protein
LLFAHTTALLRDWAFAAARMSETIISEILGGEGAEEAEAEAAVTLEEAASGDAVAMTVAMDAARFDKELSRKAGDYLERHTELVARQKKLVELQVHHFETERRLALQAARRKRFVDRLKYTVQMLITLVAVSALVGAVWMIYGAATSRRVVVDLFSTPQALAPRGITGEMIASSLLDTLKKLQEKTRSSEAALSSAGAWAGDIKIELPETGVSIGEIDRLLHEHLSHDLHIGGDLVQTEQGGLALTVRGEDVPAETFEGAAGDLEKLTVKAAEYVYGWSQPARYSAYLTETNRVSEALGFLPGAWRRAENDTTRALLANSWGVALLKQNKPPEAKSKFRQALALQPTDWIARSNLTGSEETEEASIQDADEFLHAADAAPEAQKPEPRLLAEIGNAKHDYGMAVAADMDELRRKGGSASTEPAHADIAVEDFEMHDVSAARNALDLADPDDQIVKAVSLLGDGIAALDKGDAPSALEPLGALWTSWLSAPALQNYLNEEPCFAGLAQGLAGHVAAAETIFQTVAKISGDRSRCAAYHGMVLEHAGDLPGAQRVWAENIAACPDCSFAFWARGDSEARRGQYDTAFADLARANRNSPHLAEPLKAWGDALAAQGKWPDALAKYDEALRYAPNWPSLKQAREQAAAKARG